MPDTAHSPLPDLRARIDTTTYAPEDALIADLRARAALSPDDRTAIAAATTGLVTDIRAAASPGLMEVFLAEYGLSTDEGVALMCLAEALLRVPDPGTIDALIEDKIAPSDWGRHLGQSASPLVNASTWALMLTGRVLDDSPPGVVGRLRCAIRRMGEPVIRAAVARAMKEMGRQFVLGEDMAAAMTRARTQEARGYTYSYDMLGEAARTGADAARYRTAYAGAITAIAGAVRGSDIRANPGISVKLSALHPRYEDAQKARVMAELVPHVRDLAALAANAGIGFNIDAEEADRLSLSLDVIEAVLADPGLAGWDGFGVVVQAYGRRALPVIDWLDALAARADRRLMVRLVKGAYWDTEIKRAQTLGLAEFPVFTRKEATDISYLACARRLLEAERLYPQFATHNAQTTAAILHMAGGQTDWEFQRLHGMGERLHDILHTQHGTRCRIYAPVGAHRDLLAYLVRRLLENGANSSFVNRIVDTRIPPDRVAPDPMDEVPATTLSRGTELFQPDRANARGWDLSDRPTLAALSSARTPYRHHRFTAFPVVARTTAPGPAVEVRNPADPRDLVGHARPATEATVRLALAAARPWDADTPTRGAVLSRAADLFEDDHGALFALLAREAGKTLPDAIAELREAADFLRYYAGQAQTLTAPARGTIACISPWNFPLAIFTGQVAAALAAGNAVIAKPAEQTPLIAHRAVELLLRAGIPPTALQCLPGDGATAGAALTADPGVAGVVFTGSTDTARIIRRAMADHLPPTAPLIAETGGLNAMVVDSTALPEQAVRDILASSFQSAGQRCSALRMLYLQDDIAAPVLEMLKGAMDELAAGDPWDLSTDTGPLIDADARATVAAHVAAARAEGRVLHQCAAPDRGHAFPPTVIRVGGIADLRAEVFGPVLHVATFAADGLDRVLDDVNSAGYGLTFGLHTRIDARVQQVADRMRVGNLYVNRNQIGAVVGSQPFGGEGLSGTGPKAGGPHYLPRLTADRPAPSVTPAVTPAVTLAETPSPATADTVRDGLAALPAPAQPVDSVTLPGPTGESNRLSLWPRAPFLCLGPGVVAADQQAAAVRAAGGLALALPGGVADGALADLQGFGGVVWWGDADTARALARTLAARSGPILPLIVTAVAPHMVLLERHLCVDTTASGGNAQLLAETARPDAA
ncbi:MAG: bifunctional proline dehydrogenase/L-glutamate gamma-semialdehyde dehydrogenase PutA [Rhodobacteraceae bacterium]|jgi:RHH-type proline utilization regulon transcriptional repressor/proline dehydrogenase/delta 1-pyrroline-5-carboxylate dehydrogenase|nr:bifunctional proline dehydrogenase/L-glutamate gamma-semialdehyde dehydrogenase PutA [Paracoccaceae bacterium]